MGASGWGIVCGGTTVTLPYTPEITDKELSAEVISEGLDDGTSVLISKFKRPTNFTVEGIVTASSHSSVMSTYLTPLEGFIGKTCTITAPDSQYSGNWIMESFRYRRQVETSSTEYSYSITFKQAGTHVVLVT